MVDDSFLLVSVIIPVFNKGEYLKEAIESVLRQSYQDIELILVNDGSTDESLSIIEEYAEKNSNIVSVNQENAGLSEARNVGLKKANGDFLAFLDADDSYHKEFIKSAVNILSNNDKLDFVFFDKVVIESSEGYKVDLKSYKFSKNFFFNFDFLTQSNADFSVCDKVFRRRIFFLPPINFRKHCYSEDIDFFSSLSNIRSFRSQWSNEAVYYCRNTPGSMTKSSINAAVLNYVDHLPSILSALISNSKKIETRNIIKVHISNILTSILIKSSKSKLIQIFYLKKRLRLIKILMIISRLHDGKLFFQAFAMLNILSLLFSPLIRKIKRL